MPTIKSDLASKLKSGTKWNKIDQISNDFRQTVNGTSTHDIKDFEIWEFLLEKRENENMKILNKYA